MKIVIEGLFYHRTKGVHTPNRTFPGLNDFIEAAGKGVRARATMKKKYQQIAETFIRQQANKKITGEVFIFYSFYERDRRRDPSNIASFFIKIFEDALQNCEIITNDNWKIRGYACYFYVDKDHPRVEVEIEERA